MNGKVRIKFGDLEIEFEGSEAFLKDEFIELIKALQALAIEVGPDIFRNLKQADTSTEGSRIPGEIAKLGMGSVAQKLGVSNGPELAMAAAAKLTLIDDKQKFTSKEIVGQMRESSTYFKETYASNLTKSLSGLVRAGKLSDVGSGHYALPEKSRNEIAVKLGSRG